MKRNFVIVIGILIVLGIICLGYKTALLIYYNQPVEEFDNILKNIKEKEVITNKDLANVQIDSMHVYVPQEYEVDVSLSQENNEVYRMYDTNGNLLLTINVGKDTEVLSKLQTVVNFDNEKIFEKYNLADEIDLIKYHVDHMSDRKNIFWSQSHIQVDYLTKRYVAIYMTFYNNVYYLNGDIKGYMTQSDDLSSTFVKVVNNEESFYIYSKFTSEIDTELIDNILSSIYFD